MAMARKAEEMAEVLTKIYTDRKKRFILTDNEFKEILGKGKFRTKFLQDVDGFLREKGYVLIDLHKEKDMIGVVRIETIAQWEIPEIHNGSDENEYSEEDDDEINSEINAPKLDTSF
jgi:hypothetical protein